MRQDRWIVQSIECNFKPSGPTWAVDPLTRTLDSYSSKPDHEIFSVTPMPEIGRALVVVRIKG